MGSAVAFLIAQGWASGISVWGVLVATGIADRVGWVEAPGYLGSTTVLIVAGLLLAVEFVADKIPLIDSASDTVQTLIRPAVGAAIAAEYGGSQEQVSTEIAALIGGSSAAVSHTLKAGLRAVVNMSPEPFSNALISSGEDVAGASVMSLAFNHPWVAMVIATSLMLVMILLVVIAIGMVRRLLAKVTRYEPPPPSGPFQRLSRLLVGPDGRPAPDV